MSKFDPSQHLWLEEVEGEEALTWVREQNERSVSFRPMGTSKQTSLMLSKC